MKKKTYKAEMVNGVALKVRHPSRAPAGMRSTSRSWRVSAPSGEFVIRGFSGSFTVRTAAVALIEGSAPEASFSQLEDALAYIASKQLVVVS